MLQNLYLQLKNKIKEAVLLDAKEIRSIAISEQFYVCALVTDDCYSTLFFAANSEEAMMEIVNDNSDNDWKKWYPEEWKYLNYGLGGNSRVIDVSRFLNEIQGEIGDQDFERYKSDVECVILEAIDSIKQSLREIFSNEALYIFLSMSDDDYASVLENKSAKVLNSTEQYQFFVNRYKTENDFRIEAEDAWQQKNYTLFVDLMSNIKKISSLDKKKIDFAKSKI